MKGDPPMTPDAATPVPAAAGRDWWVMAGMTIAAGSAAVASFSGLRGLAGIAGWPGRLAWLLPFTIDAYAMTSARVWLAASTPSRSARRFARANALGAIAASIAGNAAYHAVGTGLLAVSWPIIVLVGAVPAAVLGLTAHLHALRGRHAPGPGRKDGPEHGTGDRPEDGTQHRSGDRTRSRSRSRPRTGTRNRPRYRSEDDVLAAARTADARYRQAHDGRPITRDALRVALRISGTRATELRRRLADESASQPPAGPASHDTHGEND